MDKKKRAQMYQDFLRREGYVPEIDKDNDVKFKAEGMTYYIMVDENDELFFRIIFPGFWSVENQGERDKAEKAALHATAQTKVAKVFMVGDNVHAAIELFCSPPDVYRPVFQRSMSALQTAVQTFVQKMRE